MSTPALDKRLSYETGAWLVLMALTAASWWLGADHDIAGMPGKVAMILILILTFGKVAVVGHSFMELREAAPWLKRSFFGWCALMCLALTGLYLTM